MFDPNSFEAFGHWNNRWQPLLEGWAAQQGNRDAAHDITHVRRVVLNAYHLASVERANPDIVLPAAWLHDCVSVRKDSPQRSQASRMAADQAVRHLKTLDYPSVFLDPIHHAILAHSFSAGIPPLTQEAMVVQDADRLDALGAIGIARCFGTAGAMNSSFYDSQQMLPTNRPLNDSQFALDHFFAKLFRLPGTMVTESGRLLAKSRVQFMADYLRQFVRETEPRFQAELETHLTVFQESQAISPKFDPMAPCQH